MVNVLKLVVSLAVAGVLRCNHVEGQIPTCKSIYNFSINYSYTIISVRPITFTVLQSGVDLYQNLVCIPRRDGRYRLSL